MTSKKEYHILVLEYQRQYSLFARYTLHLIKEDHSACKDILRRHRVSALSCVLRKHQLLSVLFLHRYGRRRRSEDPSQEPPSLIVPSRPYKGSQCSDRFRARAYSSQSGAPLHLPLHLFSGDRTVFINRREHQQKLLQTPLLPSSLGTATIVHCSLPSSVWP